MWDYFTFTAVSNNNMADVKVCCPVDRKLSKLHSVTDRKFYFTTMSTTTK